MSRYNNATSLRRWAPVRAPFSSRMTRCRNGSIHMSGTADPEGKPGLGNRRRQDRVRFKGCVSGGATHRTANASRSVLHRAYSGRRTSAGQ